MRRRGTLAIVGLFLMAVLLLVSGCIRPSEVQQPTVTAEPREDMIERVGRISLWQNGEEQVIDPLENPKQYVQIGDLLIQTLYKLNLQARCAFSQEGIDEIKQKDTVIELIFVEPVDITISQFIEQEERHHITTDGNGYRILERVKSAIFILEDNLEEGLEAHVLVGHLIPPKMGSDHEKEWIGYGCWAIQQEGSNELDKGWCNELNEGLKVYSETSEREVVEVSQEESEEIARNYLLNSPTFKFDGIEDRLELVAINQALCPYCWQFVFEFECAYAGYGDRTEEIPAERITAGQAILKVITSHTASITVDRGEVISALMDDQWDMMEQKMIGKDTGLPEPVETVPQT